MSIIGCKTSTVVIYRFDLSKEVPYDLAVQRVAKMKAFELCSDWKLNLGWSKSNNLLYKLAKNVASEPKCLKTF